MKPWISNFENRIGCEIPFPYQIEAGILKSITLLNTHQVLKYRFGWFLIWSELGPVNKETIQKYIYDQN